MPYVIRPLGEQDVEPVHALGSSEPAFRYDKGGFWREEQLAAWFKSPIDVCIGAFERKNILGFTLTAVHHATRTAMLHNFLVEGGENRDAIARDLHDELVRRLAELGVTDLHLLIAAQRRNVHEYFEQFEFRPAGTFVRMRKGLEER